MKYYQHYFSPLSKNFTKCLFGLELSFMLRRPAPRVWNGGSAHIRLVPSQCNQVELLSNEACATLANRFDITVYTISMQCWIIVLFRSPKLPWADAKMMWTPTAPNTTARLPCTIAITLTLFLALCRMGICSFHVFGLSTHRDLMVWWASSVRKQFI